MSIVRTIFGDSAEFKARREKDFEIPQITLSEIHAVVPKRLYEKSTIHSLHFILRDIFFVCVFYTLAIRIELLENWLVAQSICGKNAAYSLHWVLWVIYWWWQGVVFAGLWCLGHEAGHGTLSSQNWFNHFVGYTLHTFLLVPFYSWRSTHRAHHKATGSVERDENYVPRTRSDYGLPSLAEAHVIDYHDVFEETPIYTLLRMLAMQIFGWHTYLAWNALGSPMYPKGTNHFNPSSALFKPEERNGIIASDIGLTIMAIVLTIYGQHVGLGAFVKLYFVPYLLANHWIVMLTFLHHSDPTIPHYRQREWTFLRGALATVDRPLLGWVGRFFLHNVSHDHIAHHLFSTIPFYNQPQVTKHLKKVLKNEYNYDSTNSFYALYRSFRDCCFIEDEGDVVFYKNRDGVAQRKLKS